MVSPPVTARIRWRVPQMCLIDFEIDPVLPRFRALVIEINTLCLH